MKGVYLMIFWLKNRGKGVFYYLSLLFEWLDEDHVVHEVLADCVLGVVEWAEEGVFVGVVLYGVQTALAKGVAAVDQEFGPVDVEVECFFAVLALHFSVFYILD